MKKKETASKTTLYKSLKQKKSVPFKGSFPLVNKTTTLFIKCQTTQLNATSTKSSIQIYNVLWFLHQFIDILSNSAIAKLLKECIFAVLKYHTNT